jgi:hypothetical protein
MKWEEMHGAIALFVLEMSLNQVRPTLCFLIVTEEIVLRGYCSRPGPKGATTKKNFVCNRGRPVCQACELSVHCRSGTICIRFKISAL